MIQSASLRACGCPNRAPARTLARKRHPWDPDQAAAAHPRLSWAELKFNLNWSLASPRHPARENLGVWRFQALGQVLEAAWYFVLPTSFAFVCLIGNGIGVFDQYPITATLESVPTPEVDRGRYSAAELQETFWSLHHAKFKPSLIRTTLSLALVSPSASSLVSLPLRITLLYTASTLVAALSSLCLPESHYRALACKNLPFITIIHSSTGEHHGLLLISHPLCVASSLLSTEPLILATALPKPQPDTILSSPLRHTYCRIQLVRLTAQNPCSSRLFFSVAQKPSSCLQLVRPPSPFRIACSDVLFHRPKRPSPFLVFAHPLLFHAI
ncbi:hypothetical protein J3F83DRAFT_743284 [Trichoderma novae-zelandiae]